MSLKANNRMNRRIKGLGINLLRGLKKLTAEHKKNESKIELERIAGK